MYVLKRIEDGKYVAIDGHVKSYTLDFRFVKFFPTKEDAENSSCGNEIAVPVG